ncbi:MAG: deoxyribonuclease IV [Chloroflexi bacterium]|nr:MAG: deoxyribonuclease IV [Anaerolineaceae bacterium 4572_32.2]RLC71723.1 MAG: deoxyribonuclease IV [Chloroflexota bacterium]RLC87402.1 MAG: deoxyribonuclease IV [Chloroflexota bacterium]HEY72266.1 deoxyribonuclease IV [Thermoflexia bacterium]
MMRLGAHESISGGLHKAFDRARSVGCDAVQIFVKPNRSWAVKPLTEEDIAHFKSKAQETDIRPVVAHASYLLNLASPKEDLWQKSRDTLIVELERCEALDVPYLVLHPGSHVGSGEEAGLKRVAQALGEVQAATPGFRARILLETTAGQGTNLGYKFEHLAWLIEHAPEGERLGVCLDTCHVFAAGYELRAAEGYEATMEKFDRIISLARLKALHLNDSKGDLGSRKDRHEHIGQGYIGLEGFRNLLNDPRLEGLPGLLETPKSNDLHEDRENLVVLRELVG